MSQAYLNYLSCAFATREFSEIAKLERNNTTNLSEIISGGFEYRSTDNKIILPCPLLSPQKFHQDSSFQKVVNDQKTNFSLEYTSIDRYVLFLEMIEKFRDQFLINALKVSYNPIKNFARTQANLFNLKISKLTDVQLANKLQELFEQVLVQSVCSKSWKNSDWFKEIPATRFGKNNLAICKVEHISQLRINAYLKNQLNVSNPNNTLIFAKALNDLYQALLTILVDARNQFLNLYLDTFWNRFLKAVNDSPTENTKSAFANWYGMREQLKTNPDINLMLQKNLGVFTPAFYEPKIHAKFIVSQILMDNLDSNIDFESLKNNPAVLKNSAAFKYLVDQKILNEDFNELVTSYIHLPSPFQGFEKEEKKFNDLLYNCGATRIIKDAMRLALGVGGAFGVFYISKNKTNPN